MKDELQDLMTDESTRKTATDWLMHVISGKRSANGQNNGAEPNGAEPNGAEHYSSTRANVFSSAAVAVAEAPDAAGAPRSGRPASSPFTAEDLCGAPVVPVIKVTTKDEITADDVCWVPEEMRLKPQPPLPEPPMAEPPVAKLHVMPSLEAREEVDIRRQNSPRGSDSSNSNGFPEPLITAADISRDPAPYLVVSMWNGIDSGSAPQEVTAADIARDWVSNDMPTPSGPDLPTSFRVIQSAASSMHPAEAAGPTVVDGTRGAAAPILEAAAPILEATVIETSAAVVEPLAPLPDVAAPVEDSSYVEASAPLAEAVEQRAEIVAPVEEIAEPSAAVENPEPVLEAAAATAGSESTETVESAVQAEVLSAGELAETEESARGERSVQANESVFARQGFWGEAMQGHEQAGENESSPRAILRGFTPPGAAEKHPEGWFTAWKTMLRLGSVLPWLARALPALEAGALGGEPGTESVAGAPGTPNVAHETRQDVAGLRLVQYEIRTTVQDHSMQLKRIEEQLTRVRESMDSRSSDAAEVAENLRAMTKLTRLAGLGLGTLLLALIVLAILLMAHH